MNSKVLFAFGLVSAAVLAFFIPTKDPIELATISPSFTSLPNLKVVATKPPFSQEKLWSLVQNWRTNYNLQPYIEDQNLCQLASIRASEIKTDWSHALWWKHVKQKDLPVFTSFSSFAENLAKDSDIEEAAFVDWLRSASHSANLHKSFEYSCLRCSGTYCAHEFASRNYIP